MDTQIKSLEDFKKNLVNPLFGLEKDNTDEIQAKFGQIAKSLFEDFAIQCEEKQYRFAEIEFYYYKKGEWSEDWNKETYPRTNKEAGELFYHYSGVDICFKSNFEEAFGEFGGILIRSLLDGKNILAGPSYCENIILNACFKSLPRLVTAEHKNFDLKKTKRCNIQSDLPDEMKLDLCYYADIVEGEKLDWTKTSERIDWDKKAERLKPKPVIRNYLNERKF